MTVKSSRRKALDYFQGMGHKKMPPRNFNNVHLLGMNILGRNWMLSKIWILLFVYIRHMAQEYVQSIFLIKSRHTSPHTEFAGVSVRSYVDLSPYCEIWAPLHELKLISSLWWINPTNSLLIWPQLIQMLCEQFADHPHAADTHHDDVIMIAMASQITSLTIVYSTLYLGTDERKHQSSASLAFVKGIHRWPVNSPHERPVARKMFPFDDVIMHRSSIDSRYLGATVVQRPIQCITNKSFQHYLLCFYYGYIQNHISNKNESGVCSVEKCQLKPHDT